MAVIFDISQTTWFQQGWMERDKMAREELRLAQREKKKALLRSEQEKEKALLRSEQEKEKALLRSEQEKNRAEQEKENAIRMSIEILLIKEVPIEFITNTFSVSRDFVLEIQKGAEGKLRK